jgi:[ribosomal protein S18]-alanine N-acetyltransferase
MKPERFDSAKDNAAELAALHKASFPDPWTAAAICELLAGPGVFAFFTEDGFVLARAAAGEAEILTLAVKPAARGRGLGRALLEAAARQAASLGAASIFLEVGADNPVALALYASLGFDRVGQRKGYYASQGAADAWVLKAQLPLPPGGNFA